MISKTPECHPDKASLDSALEQIDGVAWHINEQLREHENSMKILDIQKSLVGGQPKVIAPGRRLIKQGVLMKVPRTGATSGGGQPRYFVLFSDMVMYCKVKSSNVVLPRHNALDCGCALPLKITSGLINKHFLIGEKGGSLLINLVTQAFYRLPPQAERQLWQLLLVLQPVRSLQQGTATKSQQ